MAKAATVSKDQNNVTNRRNYWSEEITKSHRRWDTFLKQGSTVVDRYRLERQDAATDLYQDRYNILYSSTETMKPSLYAQTPKVEAVKRHPDRENDTVTYATMLIEAATQYAVEEVDFDDVMRNVVEDYMLPGLGNAWVRYDPQFAATYSNDNKQTGETLSAEGLALDYVHWKDYRTGVGRVWAELPWVGRAIYYNERKATKRFGAEKAQKLIYSMKPNEQNNASSSQGDGDQACIWEIWDKENRKVIWFSESYPDDVLDEIDDPLKLKGFWPCPKPLRAVSSTTKFMPKAFYSQYKAQAEELDNITERIRHLTKALRVVGVYDESQENLAQLLSSNTNKMVPVNNWAMFASNGGINGSIQWLPIKEVVEVLSELFRQREIVKGEIYEITGFSDIQRGVSKASETLGAQQIKNQWAGGRLKDLQKEVQRFCRDLIRIMSEIISEQFSEDSLAAYGGFEPPPVSPEEQQMAAQYAQASAMGVQPPPPKPGPTMRQQAIQQFMEVVKLLKTEKSRCALIGVETDSTIQPDESEEREARMQFLSSAGAFLQQAGPMALQFPEMRGLLGSIMMFTIRTFRASRPLEKDFEDFTKKLAAAPPTPPPGQGGTDPEVAKHEATMDAQKTQIKAQADQAAAATVAMSKKYEVDQRTQNERLRLQQDHEYRMAELALKAREVAVKEAQLGISKAQAASDAVLKHTQAAHDQSMDMTTMAHDQNMDVQGAQHDQQMDRAADERQDQQMDLGQQNEDAKLDLARQAQESASEQDA